MAEDRSPSESAREYYKEARRWYDWLFVLCSHWPSDTQPKLKAKDEARHDGPAKRQPRPLQLHASHPLQLVEEEAQLKCAVCMRFSKRSSTQAAQRAFAISACIGSVAARASSAGAAARGIPELRSHKLRQSGTLIWCQECGCYGKTRCRDLQRACSGPAGHGPRAGQLSRLKEGLHPLTRQPLGVTTALGVGASLLQETSTREAAAREHEKDALPQSRPQQTSAGVTRHAKQQPSELGMLA